MIKFIISGVGSYTPDRIVTNNDIANIVDTNDEWIYSRTGIKNRNIATNEDNVDLAYNASINAINNAKISAQDIDCIIVATSTSDYAFPSTAVLLQNKLGISNIPSFDLNAACSGFIYSLCVSAMMLNDNYKNILVVGSEILSKIIDWSDRGTCILFGDGAGSMILQKTESNKGIIKYILGSDGKYSDILYVSDSQKIDNKGFQNKQAGKIVMEGKAVFQSAVLHLTALIKDLLNDSDYNLDDIDHFIVHQANIRIIKSLCNQLNISIDKFIISIDNHANTASASVPLAFDYGIKNGLIKDDKLIFIGAFGAGITWGGALIKI